jgi:MFS family permease
MRAPRESRSSPPPALRAALLVDGLGTGAFLPFSALYFVRTTDISLSTVGSVLTAAGLLALMTPLPLGPLVDKWGPLRTAVLGNIACAVGFAGYPLALQTWEILLLTTLVSAGTSTVWTAIIALISGTAATEDRPRWFATQTVCRNLGYGIGGLAGGAAASLDTPAWFHILALADAASYVVVVVLLIRVKLTPARAQATVGERDEPTTGGYRSLLTQRRLLQLVVANVLLVLCLNAFPVVLTIYLTRTLHAPAWIAGLAFTANTGLVVAFQTVITVGTSARRHVRVVQSAAGVWAIAFVVLWFAASASPDEAVAAVAAATVLCTLAEMLYAPAINTLASDIGPAVNRGRTAAVFQLSWALAFALAPALLLGLLALRPSVLWTVMLACCAAGAGALAKEPRASVSRTSNKSNSRRRALGDLET